MMKDYEKATLNFYNENHEKFIDSTKKADMSRMYELFIKYIKPEGSILDLGCGTGRDSMYFSKLGYRVLAIDGSVQLCEYARQQIGNIVECKRFSEIDYVDEFDGVWACASLLHLKRKEILTVLRLISKALKKESYLYASFKLGDFEEMRDGKFYL
ncbi:MAG: class I SAM-dependent methyltransferase, partial [Anaerovoracaceae bacterium]